MTESRPLSVSWRSLAEPLPLALGVAQLFHDLLLGGLEPVLLQLVRSMLALSDFDGVLSADGGAAARGVIGRPSSPVTVLMVAPVGGSTAAVASMSGAQDSRSDELLDMAAAGERQRQRKKLRTLLELEPKCLRQCA